MLKMLPKFENIFNDINLIKREVTCSICLDLYTEPITLTTCQHTFCLECFKKLFSSKTSPKQIKCAICKIITKRRSYYLNEQFIKTVELFKMFDKLLVSLEEKGSINNYDADQMSRYLDDCEKYKDLLSQNLVRTPTSPSPFSFSDNESTKLLDTKSASKAKRKSNKQENESKSTLNKSKTSNIKVKPLKITKSKRKTPKKKAQKSTENSNNTEILNIDEYVSPDTCELQNNENKIVKLMEDEVLQNFDNVVNAGLQKHTKKEKKHLEKHESNLNLNLKSVESDSSKRTILSSGWSRMKTMKKQLKKKENKYKKLNVSTEINRSKSKSPQEKNKTTTAPDELQPVVLLQRMGNNQNNSNEKVTANVSDKNDESVDKLDIPLKSIDNDLRKEPNIEDDIFSLSTQKLKTPPNKEETYTEKKKSIISSSSCDKNNEITNFFVEVQVHHSSTPLRIRENLFQENNCDTKKTPKSSEIKIPTEYIEVSNEKEPSEKNVEIISVSESTPDSVKKVGVRTRKSLRSAKRNSDEIKSVRTRKSSPKKRKIIEKHVDKLLDIDNNNENDITLIDKVPTTTQTSNKIKLIGDTKNAQNKNGIVVEPQLVENELKLCVEQAPKVMTILESTFNAVDAVLSQCSNYLQSPILFSDNSSSKNSKTSDKIGKPKVLTDKFISLPLPSNSITSVEFYKTAIPCLQKIKKFYDEIKLLSQELIEDTLILRNTPNNSKEDGKVLLFKSAATASVEIQTDNITCPKCLHVIDYTSNNKPTEICSNREVVIDVETSNKYNNKEISQKSKASNISCNLNNIFPNLQSSTTSEKSQKSNSDFNHNKKVNRQLTYSDESSVSQKRKFKRIRSPTPESESESNKSKKSNANYSRLLYRDDINVIFQSEPTENNPNLYLNSQIDKRKLSEDNKRTLTNPEDKNLSINSNDTTSKYISILEKEYQDAHFTEEDKLQTSEKQNCDTAPNTILDNLLGNVKNKNALAKNVFKSQLCSEEARNVDNLLDNIDLTDLEDNFDSTNTNMKNKQDSKISPNRNNKGCHDMLSASIFSHMDRDFNKIPDSDKTNSTEQIFNKSNNREDGELDKEVENLTSRDVLVGYSIESDEDLFEDVVDSTPQKPEESKRMRSSKDPLEQVPGILGLPSETEKLDCIDIVPLPPPLEFQDTEKEQPELNIQNVSSITPDIYTLNNLNKGFFENISFLSRNASSQTVKEPTQKVQEESTHSENIILGSVLTPLKEIATSNKSNIPFNLETNVKESAHSENVISSSVTHMAKIATTNKNNSQFNTEGNILTQKNLNPIVLAQREKYSPLQVLVSYKSPKQFIPIPKQQTSILNYMQTSQKENNVNNINRNQCRTPVKTLNNKSNTVEPIEVCESPVPEKRIPITSNIDKSENESTKNTTSSKYTAYITASRLKRDEIIQIISLSQKLNARYSKDFNENVTHVVVAVDDQNQAKDHTMKYILGIAHGKWIVSPAWLKSSLEHNRLLPEEPYEVLDVSGRPGPKISRLTRLSEPLLKNYVMCCVGPLKMTNRADIEDIILRLEGEVRQSPKELVNLKGKIGLILIEMDSTHDIDQFQEWRNKYNALVIDIEWLCRTVGQYLITSVRPYLMCSEEGITDLGFPYSLIAAVPETPSQITNTNN